MTWNRWPGVVRRAEKGQAGGMGVLSGHLRSVRFARVLPHVSGDVLDVGCQGAMLLALADRQIRSYFGIDINSEAVEAARAAHPSAEFAVCDLDAGPFDLSRQFDTIVMCAVVEHLFNLRTVFQNLARHLKPGGQIVLTTPTVLGNDVVHFLGAKLGLFAQAAQDDHIVIFNRQRFHVLAKEVGLQVARHDLFQFGCNQLAILRSAPDISRSSSVAKKTSANASTAS